MKNLYNQYIKYSETRPFPVDDLYYYNWIGEDINNIAGLWPVDFERFKECMKNNIRFQERFKK